MATQQAKSPSELEADIMLLFEQSAAMTIGLSEDDSVYDLNFISGKLAKLSTYQERLSDIMMSLTRYSFSIKKVSSAKHHIYDAKVRDTKALEFYQDLPLNEKKAWLENQLTVHREEDEIWLGLSQLVSEVKGAVERRAGDLKRLDSDIRLHAKIYEAKVAAGATHPASYKGSSSEEVDLE